MKYNYKFRWGGEDATVTLKHLEVLSQELKQIIHNLDNNGSFDIQYFNGTTWKTYEWWK